MVAVIKPYVLFFCVLLINNALGATKDDFYEDALVREREGDLAGAIIQLKNALQASPEFLPGWVKISEAYLLIAHGAAAENAIKKAQVLGADPEFTMLPLAKAYLLQGKIEQLISIEAPPGFKSDIRAKLLIIQGNALLETHRFDRARDLYRQAANLAPDNIDHILGRAMVEMRAGHPELAEPFLEDAIKRAPNSAEAWYINAELRRNQGNREESLRYFTEAISLRSEHIPALLGRAAILIDMERLNEAAADLEQALAADPENLQALYLEAGLQRRRGDEKAATETLNAAKEIMDSLPQEVIANHLPSLMVSAAIAMRNNNFERAQSNLERYLNHFPGHWGARKMLATTYLALDAPANARPILLSMAKEAPEDPQIMLLLGNTYAAMGWHDEAIAALTKAQVLGLDTADIHTRIGASLLSKGDSNGALESFKKANIAGDTTQAKLMTYYLHLTNQDPIKALGIAEELVEASPDNAGYHNLAAALKLMLGHRDVARAQFEHAQSLDPEFLTPQLNLAEMQRQDSNYDEAVARYSEILEHHPQSIGAMRGLAEIATAQKRYETAIQWLTRLTSIDGELVGDRISLVKLFLLKNDITSAKEELRALREDHPLRLDVALLLAKFEHTFSNISASRDAFADATRMAQGSASKLVEVGKHQIALGFDEDALRNLSRARILDENNLNIIEDIARIKIRLGRIGEAHTHADSLIKAMPEKVNGYQIRAEAYAHVGRHEEAVEEFSKVLNMNRSMANVSRLMKAYVAAGHPDEAVITASAWLSESPSHHDIRASMALILMRTGKIEEAINTYEMVVTASPEHLGANNNLAILYDRIGDTRSVAQARRSLSLNNTSAAILDTAGWILAKNGYVEEGLSYLRQAYARNASEPSIKYHLAQVLVNQGDKDEARRLLTDALANPEFENRDVAEKLLLELTDS